MGLFSDLLNGPKELTKITTGVVNIKNVLDEYENDPDFTYLCLAAWIGRVAIIDVMDKNNYPFTYSLYVPVQGHQIKMTLHEAYMTSIGRLSVKAGKLSDREKDYILEILDKGNAFYEIDKQISLEQKELFL